MKKIILDLEDLGTPEEVQDYLAERMEFPDYYGKNLDALHDCLTDISEDTAVGIYGIDEESYISDYLWQLRQVFEDSEEENPRLAVFFA
ncbi:MAG: barstar family protein [Lachnospiraceae bacterium]|jgi:ribonuclease inhibitor|nr:barstar family protein [Lachnospiraceae bacterium]